MRFCWFWNFFADFESLLVGIAHPDGHALAHALLEGEAEGAVTVVAALFGELLGGEGMGGVDGLAIAADEVADA